MRTRGRVLLIDDNADALYLMQILLSTLGYTTETAGSGKDGIALARTFVPDVVFLDLGMPDMLGYDVARALRKIPQLEHAFILALTGWNDQATRAAVIEAGFDRHLVKPARHEQIAEILEQYFAGHAGSDEASVAPKRRPDASGTGPCRSN